MIHPVIAIDGPSASGKGTVAKFLAEKLNFVHVDTGAMYRAFAWQALKKKVDATSRDAVKKLIEETKFEVKIEGKSAVFLIDGENVEPHIRSEQVNKVVSMISAIPELREYLVNRQRQLRLQAPLVMDGRDIGTVVATDSPYKFFLDASPEVRAARRRKQGQADVIAQRDKQDSTRAVSPTIRAADAEYVDTGAMTAQEVAEHVKKRIIEKGFLKQKAVSPV
ncbi:MAG: (d)CMP kinase [Verrucomicrobiota bacterium]